MPLTEHLTISAPQGLLPVTTLLPTSGCVRIKLQGIEDTTTILSMKGFKTTNPWSCCTRNQKSVSRLGGPPGMAQSTAGPDPPGAAPAGSEGPCQPGVSRHLFSQRSKDVPAVTVAKGSQQLRNQSQHPGILLEEKKPKTLPGHSSRNMTSPLLPSSKTLVTTFNWQMLTHIHQPSCKNVNARPCQLSRPSNLRKTRQGDQERVRLPITSFYHVKSPSNKQQLLSFYAIHFLACDLNLFTICIIFLSTPDKDLQMRDHWSILLFSSLLLCLQSD